MRNDRAALDGADLVARRLLRRRWQRLGVAAVAVAAVGLCWMGLEAWAQARERAFVHRADAVVGTVVDVPEHGQDVRVAYEHHEHDLVAVIDVTSTARLDDGDEIDLLVAASDSAEVHQAGNRYDHLPVDGDAAGTAAFTAVVGWLLLAVATVHLLRVRRALHRHPWRPAEVTGVTGSTLRTTGDGGPTALRSLGSWSEPVPRWVLVCGPEQPTRRARSLVLVGATSATPVQLRWTKGPRHLPPPPKVPDRSDAPWRRPADQQWPAPTRPAEPPPEAVPGAHVTCGRIRPVTVSTEGTMIGGPGGVGDRWVPWSDVSAVVVAKSAGGEGGPTYRAALRRLDGTTVRSSALPSVTGTLSGPCGDELAGALTHFAMAAGIPVDPRVVAAGTPVVLGLGWLPDPSDPSRQRWWNGREWTQDTRDPPDRPRWLP